MKTIFTYCVSFVILFSFSSIEETPINGNTLDSDKLEELIMVKVNNLRASKKLNRLELNPILEKAAQDHATYLKGFGKLSHNQKVRKKKTPMERTDFYKGNFSFVGENVAYTYLNESVVGVKNKRNAQVLDTYEKAAQYIFDLWRYSRDHYVNMIDKDFKLSRIRFSYDNKTKRIYAVHVFGAN